MRNIQTVTIIGGGIVGICCALSLQERGYQVVVLDRDEPGQGASMGNAGVISPWSCVPQSMPGLWKNIPRWMLSPKSPLSVSPAHSLRFLPWAISFLTNGREHRVREISTAMERLVSSNIEMYRHYLAGTGHETLLKGSNYVFVTRHSQDNFPAGLAWKLRERIGAPMRRVCADELREIEPALSHDFCSAILLENQSRTVSPGKLSNVLASKVKSQGGKFLRISVKALQKRDEGEGWEIETEAGRQLAEYLVIAAGAWSAKLLAPLGLKLPLEAERGYHTIFKNPGVSLNNSIADMDNHVVSSSMENGLRTAGTAEFAGLEAAPNYSRAKLLIDQTKQMIPDLNISDTDFWMGTRPSFPDSLPAISKINGHSDIVAAFGHSHYGLGMAPITGQLAAELISGGSPNIDMKPYSIHRFGA